jgi:20S proteasome alpha/beta subunit
LTLVIAAHGKDCVVVGADSRGTTQQGGTRVETNTVVKMFPVGKQAVVLICGDSGPSTNLVDLLATAKVRRATGVRAVATQLAQIARQEAVALKDVPTHPRYFPNFAFIVAGLEKKGGQLKPCSFALRSETGFRLELSQTGREMDGKPMIALYIFEKKYQPDQGFDQLATLVAQTLYDTSRVDGDVGGRLRVGVVDVDGFRELPQEDVEGRCEKW